MKISSNFFFLSMSKCSKTLNTKYMSYAKISNYNKVVYWRHTCNLNMRIFVTLEWRKRFKFLNILTVRMALIQPYCYRPRHQIWLFLLQTSNLVPKRGSRWFLTSSTTHCHMSVFTAFLAHFPIFGLFSLIKSTFLDPKLMDIYK